MSKRYQLSQVVAELREDRPGIEIEADGGAVFRVPPPELWPDLAIDKASSDPIAAARVLLGDQYNEFTEAGGSAALLFHIIGQEVGTLGESSAS